MKMIIHITLIALVTLSFFTPPSNEVNAQPPVHDPLMHARSYFDQRHYFLAIQAIDEVLQDSRNQAAHGRAYGMKGIILLLMQRYSEAEKDLLRALELTDEAYHKADYADSLGVLYQKMREPNKARQYFDLALTQAGTNTTQVLKIQLNRLRTQPQLAEQSQLETWLSEISTMQSPEERVRYYMSLAAIAAHQKQTISIAQTALEKAYRDNTLPADSQIQLELLDSLADLYEKQGNEQQALRLSEQASHLSNQLDADDLMIQIEWRKGRIYQRQGRDNDALFAYRKAIDHIQVLRRDIPITYENGRSSFRETLGPIYSDYTNLLLKKSSLQAGMAKQQILQLARQTIEQLKQSELEDFLGGRCLIEGLQRSELELIDPQAAILYPIILPDRLELLVTTYQEIQQYTVPVPAQAVNEAAENLSHLLRQYAEFPEPLRADDFRQYSEQLYRWLIAPLAPVLLNQAIKTLVVIPDGVLRLVPFAALSDGQNYLIEKIAIVISPGINLASPVDRQQLSHYQSLLAGLSHAGPVVNKLQSFAVQSFLNNPLEQGHTKTRRVRSLFNKTLRKHTVQTPNEPTQKATARSNHADNEQELRERLSLPGVEAELAQLKQKLKNTTLINDQFTTQNFYHQVSEKPYEIIHIASHGVFSSDANNSFIIAYDDVLKLDDLKAFLQRKRHSQGSIQLLTFSACNTAEGDDRAPLGFAGAALKAEAQAALGSLWPVSDEDVPLLMSKFYENLTQQVSKTESLRRAQLELLKHPGMNHPAIWSPFILVGNWL